MLINAMLNVFVKKIYLVKNVDSRELS